MGNVKKIIELEAGDESCPADALMLDFRKRANLGKKAYSKNIEFSDTCIDFFRKMADIVEEYEKNIMFRWYAIEEEELPPLIVKIRKYKGRYYLQYLKELGEEKTVIKGRQRKGKNKNGKILIEKEEEER